MEGKGCSQRWNVHLAEFEGGRRRQGPTTKDYSREPGGQHKAVWMAPNCSYHADRQYAMRKPLFTAHKHTSILKKTHPHKHTEKEQQFGFNSGGETQQHTDTRAGGDWSPAEPAVSEHCHGNLWRSHLPLRPSLTSTVLSHTYIPHSSQQLREGNNNTVCSTGGHSKGSTMSPYQASYWACAIPKALPPSAGRDPDKNYLALLDYSYPLRAGDSLLDYSYPLRAGDSLLDSGIEVDPLHSSSSLSGLGCSAGPSRERGMAHLSPDLHGFTTSSIPDQEALCLDHLDCSNNRGGMKPSTHHQTDTLRFSQCVGADRFLSQWVAAEDSVPSQPWCISEEVDQEFLRLPDRLEELQLLSSQVREVTAQLSRPVAHTTSSSLRPADRELRKASHMGDELEAEAGQRSCGASVEQLAGLSLQDRDSLMQHIQVFCSHLEQLIQGLYTVSEKRELLAEPTVDIDSVKSCLAEYQRFEREVNNQQPLASRALTSGRCLLSCINATAPFLKEALLLIERQCGVLQSHTEHLFSSVLSDMS